MQLNFRSLAEDQPSDALRQVFAHGWPGWSEWVRKRHTARSTDLRDARLALRRNMPEFERLWDNWVDVCGADENVALFLSFWSPPRYLVNCTQAVFVDHDGPLLIRNYDLDPHLNESTLLSTRWRGRRVAGMVEGIVGLADGMNDAGLAASLTFGGRTIRAAGFGIPLIIRYVLEMCTDVQQAVEALRSVTSHMSYNVSVVDASGDWATVYLAPDRPAIVTRSAFTTNHQLGVEWPRHGRFSNTKGRSDHLEILFQQPDLTADRLLGEFLRPPLASTGYSRGFGTIYTALYRPVTQKISLVWMDGSREDHDLDAIGLRERLVHFSPAGSHSNFGTSGDTIIPRAHTAPQSHWALSQFDDPHLPKTA
jgi:predicted choloylglycine hydrolase